MTDLPEGVPAPLDALLAKRDWVRALARRLVASDDDADEIELRIRKHFNLGGEVATPPAQTAGDTQDVTSSPPDNVTPIPNKKKLGKN